MHSTISYVAVAACAVVAGRLVLQAIRAQKLAEGLLGACILLASTGLVVAIKGVNALAAGDSSSYDLTRWGMLSVSLGVCCFIEFVRRTFRPDEQWAKALSLTLCGAVLAGWYRVMYCLSYGYLTEPHPAAFTPRLLAFTWGIVESFAAYRTHKKRLAVGLADPVVVNRFLLFVFWNLLMIAVPASNALMRNIDTGVVSALYRVFPWTIGTALAIVTLLIFFPPGAYLDYLLAGHTGEAEDAA